MNENSSDAPIVRARGIAQGVRQATRDWFAPSTTSISRSPAARRSRSWGRAAAGSRPCCTCSAASTARRGGELWLDGKRIDQLSERGLAKLRRREVGFVFQAFHLMDELTAQENVELPALLAGRSPRQARQRALELLDQVGLADRGGHLPSALSGGQRQRVAIARALVNEPLVVLADEPTGNLDSAATLEVLRLFDHLHASGLTLVIVTHDERVAATADRIVSMRDGALVDETRLTGGTRGNLADLVSLER